MPKPVLETLISRQLHQYHRWRGLLEDRAAAAADPESSSQERIQPGPVVTISRMSGCRARDLAGPLAQHLGVQVWGRELVDRIAGDVGLQREVVERLDQGLVDSVEAWVRAMLGRRLFLRDDYALALARTIKTLAETGGAVLIGRGAGFILGDRADLRLRLVAGERHRLQVLQQEHDLDLAGARDHLRRTDQARAAFVRSYFHADVDDPRNYDLVVNMERLRHDAMVSVCLRLLEERRRRTMVAEG
jgi:cytidylate kinase